MSKTRLVQKPTRINHRRPEYQPRNTYTSISGRTIDKKEWLDQQPLREALAAKDYRRFQELKRTYKGKL